LIFYFTDLENATSQDLKPGDEVEFNISYNNRNSKYFANKVKKINTQAAANAVPA
jgi:cold shock CspA family protein